VIAVRDRKSAAVLDARVPGVDVDLERVFVERPLTEVGLESGESRGEGLGGSSAGEIVRRLEIAPRVDHRLAPVVERVGRVTRLEVRATGDFESASDA
jgi:hypothetical protein